MHMAEIILSERKPPVLKHPSLHCISRYHTINLTAGCPYGCRYCYAQGFRSNPGRGKVVFYSNTLELLRRELPRKRTRPELIYFSTACEPFIPDRRILDCQYGIMELLLKHSVFLLILTKSRIPARFLDLFSDYPKLVHVQVGLTTINDDVRRFLEPDAAPVTERLGSLEALIRRKVTAEVRADPLVPGLTDTDDSLAALFRAGAESGARRAVASYLFVRPSNVGSMTADYCTWSFREMVRDIYTAQLSEYCSGGPVRLPRATYRRKSYARLKRIADRFGITVELCGCKNPDITSECCHPGPPESDVSQTQLQLFD